MRLMFLAWALFSMTAMAGDRLPTMVEVTQLESGMLCGDHEPGVRWIEDLQQYQALTGVAATESAYGELQEQQLLLVSMGQRSSAGFYLALAESQAQLQDGVIHLSLAWHSPAPGQMSAQMITRPCLLVALPRQAYQGVRVYDQHGELRHEHLLEVMP